jgi:mono/diheme cytochrome c family protein
MKRCAAVVKTFLVVMVAGACGALQSSVGAAAQTSTQPSTATAAATGNAQAGKDLYVRYSCYACHGYAGHGGAGARLVPMRMTLPTFTAYVRGPRQMPSYSGKVLTDAQMADIWAYIQALPKSPVAKDIPLLAQILNEK